jgi:flavin reductase (DIM6/NTAB) family NADH-FMN oxidoreductase RutF
MQVQKPDERTLRDVLRFWATGVAIVSSAHAGWAHGMTVNSFTSLSLDPPLVMVSLEKKTRTHDMVQASGSYAVSVLAQSQQQISERFAGRDTEQSNRFKDLETITLETGCPILSGALGFFDCRVVAEHDAGTHTVSIGEVLVAGFPAPNPESTPPLLYFNRDYRHLAG